MAEELEQAKLRYAEQYGLGQYSHFRFAEWLMENEPLLAIRLLESHVQLLSMKGLSNENKQKAIHKIGNINNDSCLIEI